MLTVDMPDGRQFSFKQVVFDYNGTLADNGEVAAVVKEMLAQLAEIIPVTVMTADTFGLAANNLRDIAGVKLIILSGDTAGGIEKADYVSKQGAEHIVVIGNGINDRQMCIVAALAICVAGPEGAARETVAAADILVTRPEDAIRLLLEPKRLIATLRL